MSPESQDWQSIPDSTSAQATDNRDASAAPPFGSGTSANQDRETGSESASTSLAILPIRGLVLFPGMVVPLTIGRPSALKLVDSELPESKQLGLVTQRDEQMDRPGPSDLYSVGVST